MRFLTSILFATACGYLPAQERTGSFMVYKNVPELTGKRITTVCQSKYGYLWIGTSDGLVRFDGRRYQTYHADGDGLTDNQVSHLLEDDSGRLWIAGNLHGLSRYNPRTGSFTRWKAVWSQTAQFQRVYKLAADGNKNIWLATAAGLAKYEEATGTFKMYQTYGKVPIINMLADTEDKNRLWAISTDSLYLFDTQSKQFTAWSASKCIGNSMGRLAWNCIEPCGKGALWLGTWGNGLWKFEIATRTLQKVDLKKDEDAEVAGLVIMDVAQVNDTLTLVACGMYGLLQYNTQKGITSRAIPPLGLYGTALYAPDYQSITCTSDAGVWVGTSGQLLQWHPAFQRLRGSLQVNYRANESELLVSEMTYDAEKGVHLLACAGKAGMVVANPSLNQAWPVEAKGGNDKVFADVAKIPDGPWIALAHFTGATYQVFAESRKMTHYKLPGLAHAQLTNLENDRKGRLWAADNSTLYCFASTDAPPLVFELKNKGNKPANLVSYSLLTDTSGRAWLSTNLGLWRADADKQTLHHLSPQNDLGRWMAAELVKSIAIDGKNGVWVGYDGQGLQLIDSDSMQVVLSWDAKNLPSSSINHLAITGRPQLVAATSAGLGVLNKIGDGWNLYTVNDGLEEDFLDRPVYASPTGKLVINLRDGLQVFDEEQLASTRQHLEVHVSQMRANNLPLPPQTFAASGSTVKLPHFQNNIDLSFAAMHWLYPGATRFYYRLANEKANSPWIQLAEPNLVLPALRPGAYRLELLARGAGSSTSQPFVLTIRIQNPFWLSWWFITLAVLTTLGAAYALYRYRLNQLIRTQQVRNTISQNLHDDIGSSLSNIQILNELARRNMASAQTAESYLQKSAEDIQRVSEALSDIVWNVNPKYDDLHNLLIRMKRYAGDLLDGKGISHLLNFPEVSIHIVMPMEQRRDFYLIFKEALNNLVKYARATEARVEIVASKTQVALSIADNGIGFDAEHTPKGNGLENMKQRARRWKGRLLVESRPDQGTTITLSMPLAK